MDHLFSIVLSGGMGLIGGAFISTALYNRAEYSTASFVATLVLGILLAGGGLYIFFAVALPGIIEDRKIKKKLDHDLAADRTDKEDEHPSAALVTQFKETYRAFFAARGIPENSTLQDTTTQMYWHILTLQKRRLDQKKISLDFQSERKNYGGRSIDRYVYNDARFCVTEVRERISALRTYQPQRGKSYQRKDTELAHYALVNARTTSSENRVICPNCGNETTRENLLDGCDFCGTKFRVEDLGRRVSSFVLRDDYQTMLAKYNDFKTSLIPWTMVLFISPFFLVSLIGMLSAWNSLEAGFFMKLTAVILGTALLTALGAWIGKYAAMVLMTPLLWLIDRVAGNYLIRGIKKRVTLDEQNVQMVYRVRSDDRLFSRENFFSNVQNKLAAIHYAGSAAEAQVFSVTDLSGLAEQYRDVVDMDVLEMKLTDYRKDESYQTITMEVLLDLLYAEKHGFKKKSEHLALTLVRDAGCKTEAVCAPSVFKCKNCGNSLTLLNGGRCEYCGSELKLSEYDWVIKDYRILPK